jgi:predicted nucleic acid-binding Zn ribbon protein
MRSHEPRSFGSALGEVLCRLGLGQKLKEYEILERWKEIVGERIALQSDPEHIEKGTLLVRVKSPAWRNELLFLKREILQKINARAGQELVKDIIFR